MSPRDWNAGSYDRLSSPQEAMGRDVLDRLDLRGDETVLDAGCGSGRVTALVAERVPNGRVIGIDGSPSMIEEARRRLGDAVELRVGDLLELDLEGAVDAVLSTATFHWIADHDRLFARVHAALRPGGRFAAQCGGEGNLPEVGAALAAVVPGYPELAAWAGPWHYASPLATAARLQEAGFADVWTWRTSVDVVPDDFSRYLETVILGAHVDRLPEERRAEFVADVDARLPTPELRYVRLNMLARRPRRKAA